MQRWRGLPSHADVGRSVVTIGIFDGVHLGHVALIGKAVELSQDKSLASIVVTFDPHPAEVVRPGSHPLILTELPRKAELVEQLGVDGMCVLPFTPEFSRMSPEDFVSGVLVGGLAVDDVVVGENFRFGHQASGDMQLLRTLGLKYGFDVHPQALRSSDGNVLSSTRIRSLIREGKVKPAAEALGRPHRIEGLVVRGDGRGREIGFPTANVETHAYVAIPVDGVYAGWFLRGEERFPTAVSIGTNPTFTGADPAAERRVEAYLLDADRDLYGDRVAIEFVERVRDMERFESVEELVVQIDNDVEVTRQLLSL